MITTTASRERAAKFAPTKPYEAQDYSSLLGMQGFSDKLLNTHFKLYQGYVSNTNALLEEMQHLLNEGKDRTPDFAEVKRRFGWEFDGMRLHEYYFENLGGKEPLSSSSQLIKIIDECYGNFDNWKKDFVSTGAMRGIGWVILYRDEFSGRLINTWIEQHNTNHLAGSKPILVLDVFEHAYLTDYGTDKASYINNFFKNINWSTVEERL